MQYTKQAIMDTTLELAKRRPLKKVTVKTIADACGITRNTFYYYFHDIYDVLDNIIVQKVRGVTREKRRDYEKALVEVFEFFAAHKQVWINLYRSLGHERMYTYCIRYIHDMIVDAIKQEATDVDLSGEDIDVLAIFYEEAIYGVIIRWLHSDMWASPDENSIQLLVRIQSLFDGHIRTMLEGIRAHQKQEAAAIDERAQAKDQQEE